MVKIQAQSQTYKNIKDFKSYRTNSILEHRQF